MQSIKYFVRAIGDASKGMGVVTAAEAEQDINYNYLSQGYVVQNTSYLGSIRDTEGNDVGYRILHVLLKDEEPRPIKVKEAK